MENGQSVIWTAVLWAALCSNAFGVAKTHPTQQKLGHWEATIIALDATCPSVKMA